MSLREIKLLEKIEHQNKEILELLRLSRRLSQSSAVQFSEPK